MASSPDSWQTIEALFQPAQELEPAQRPEFLTANCPDSTILEEVQRLLNDEQQAGNFLSTPAVDHSVRALSSDRISIGQTLANRFQVVRFIGAGAVSPRSTRLIFCAYFTP
jgi:hypothetical protein